jgi:hypothetical protein
LPSISASAPARSAIASTTAPGRFRSSSTTRLPRRSGLSPLPPEPLVHGALLRPRDHGHLGTHVGQHATGQRTGTDALELDDADARQRRIHANSFRAIRSFMISVVPP